MGHKLIRKSIHLGASWYVVLSGYIGELSPPPFGDSSSEITMGAGLNNRRRFSFGVEGSIRSTAIEGFIGPPL